MNKKAIFFLIIGSIIMGLGLGIGLKAGLGMDPLSLFWEALVLHTRISMGMANIVASIAMILVCLFIDKKLMSIGTIVNPIIVSTTMNLIGKIPFTPSNFLIQLIIIMIGFILLSLGIAIYSNAKMGVSAYDALVFGLSNRTHRSIAFIRIILDLMFFAVSILFGVSFKIGPILAIIFVGNMIQFFIELFNKTDAFKI